MCTAIVLPFVSRLVILQRTVEKCTKIYNACVQPLLSLLFGDGVVAVAFAIAVVVYVSSLLVFGLTR